MSQLHEQLAFDVSQAIAILDGAMRGDFKEFPLFDWMLLSNALTDLERIFKELKLKDAFRQGLEKRMHHGDPKMARGRSN